MKTKLFAFVIFMLATFSITLPLGAQSLAVNSISYKSISAKQNNNVTAISLQNVMKLIENKFKVSIAYQSELIKDKSVMFEVSTFSSPEAALNKALASFNLSFEKIRKRFYLISSVKSKVAKSFEVAEPNLPVSVSVNWGNKYVSTESSISSIDNFKSPKALPPIKITGRVSDKSEAGLIGVSVNVKGTKIGAMTDLNGRFTLTVPDNNAILAFSYVGYDAKEVPVKGLKDFSDVRVILEASTGKMEEVVITAFGTRQKKESVVSAITTINPSELRVPSSNLTTALAGRLAGVIAYQRSGEPGLDNAEFFIRGVTTFSTAGKKDPLILIDGVEMNTNDLARLNVDDIAAFSVMKDASSAALYGARGANGVILVTTKEGKKDKLQVSLRTEQSSSYNTQLAKLADPITYMKLHNEAVRTRNPLVALPYSLSKIYGTEQPAADPTLYPSVDWYNYLIANKATNRRVNINITGGGQTVQYYLAANYQNDKGILKESKENLFNNNINVDRFQVRSNVTIKFAPTTTGIVRAYGSFDDMNGPQAGGASVFNMARNATPVAFQPYYQPDSANEFTKHILFGMGSELGAYVNPLAEVISSYKQSKESMMLLQLEMNHKFTGALNGFSLKGTYNVLRRASYAMSRGYSPFYYVRAMTLDGSYKLAPLNPDLGTEYLTYSDGDRTVSSSQYGEARLGYNKTFNDKHDVNAMFVGTIRSATGTGNGSSSSSRLQASLPQRNISSAGRLAYGYDSRYFFELDYGYNGTERFAKKNRFGFFPAAGAGWMVSNESFMSGAKKIITSLKLRATYGKVGNDQIGSLDDRFFYLSQVNMNGTGYSFGLNGGIHHSGITINRYANDLITWEIAKKLNLGIDLELFNGLTIIADYFQETRENILQTRANIPTTMGLRTIPQANLGVAKGHGFETELKYQRTFNNGIWLLVNGNITYATSKYKKYEEPDYSDAPWRLISGLKINQPTGYIAERLFIDEEDVNNSPTQQFGQYGAGDIKYKDINNDGLIGNDDIVPIGFPTVPEIIYGAGFSAGYKGFDLSLFFQGSARSSFFISPGAITPFINRGQRALMQFIADDHWSENNRNINAFWPRLSEYALENNNQSSTHWLRNGSFVRLKSAEIGYTLPEKLTKKAYLRMLRFYASGTNLFLWSKFKMWDPEMAGNGLGYPVQRIINFGINLQL